MKKNLLPGVGRPNGGRLGNRKERTGCLTCKCVSRMKIDVDQQPAHPLRFLIEPLVPFSLPGTTHVTLTLTLIYMHPASAHYTND